MMRAIQTHVRTQTHTHTHSFWPLLSLWTAPLVHPSLQRMQTCREPTLTYPQTLPAACTNLQDNMSTNQSAWSAFQTSHLSHLSRIWYSCAENSPSGLSLSRNHFLQEQREVFTVCVIVALKVNTTAKTETLLTCKGLVNLPEPWNTDRCPPLWLVHPPAGENNSFRRRARTKSCSRGERCHFFRSEWKQQCMWN